MKEFLSFWLAKEFVEIGVPIAIGVAVFIVGLIIIFVADFFESRWKK